MQRKGLRAWGKKMQFPFFSFRLGQISGKLPRCNHQRISDGSLFPSFSFLFLLSLLMIFQLLWNNLFLIYIMVTLISRPLHPLFPMPEMLFLLFLRANSFFLIQVSAQIFPLQSYLPQPSTIKRPLVTLYPSTCLVFTIALRTT